jgi:hypothetical protein
MKAEDIRRGGIPKKEIPKNKVNYLPLQSTMPVPLEKVPWPGISALHKCCLYGNNIISDRSGYDEMCRWKLTATPDEIILSEKKAKALGWFEGYIGTYFAIKLVEKMFR